MSRPYSGRELVNALRKWNFERIDQTGSHVKLRYVDPNTGEKRYVTVPMHDEVSTDTLHSIAEQAGAEDFQKFLDAINELV